MSIHSYNVTVQMVKDKLDLDTRRIGSGTNPLSDEMISDWIDEASSEFSGLLQKAGLDGSDLSGEAEKQIQMGIIWYAAREAYAKLGHTGQKYDRAESKYEDARSRYENSPQLLDKSQSRVRSNVDTSKDESEFQRNNYKF